MSRQDDERSSEGDVRTDGQRAWAAWAKSGYAKRYQPASMLRLGFVLSLVLVIALASLFVLAAHGRLP